MSNRLVYILLMFATVLVIGVLAFSAGLRPVVSGANPDEQVTSIIGPTIGILGTVLTFLMALNARVLEGTVQPGSVADLISMGGFFPSWVSVGVGAASLFGVQVLSPETQGLIVTALTNFTAILLYSFANRAPGSPDGTAQIVAQKAKFE